MTKFNARLQHRSKLNVAGHRSSSLLRRCGTAQPRPVALEALEQRQLLAFADPATANNPIWHAVEAPSGSIIIDGKLRASEWAGAQTIVRTMAFDSYMRATLRATPELSNNYLGEITGVDGKTVACAAMDPAGYWACRARRYLRRRRRGNPTRTIPSTIQNSIKWRRVFDFSARNVGPKQ